MVYLIPAWYQENKWNEIEQYWYWKKAASEFDDTVKQMQLFHRNKVVDYKLILLSCSPNFRHFLHRKSVMRAPYWSCFDAIQEIKRKKTVVFSFHDIKWPEGVEFVYTPFALLVYLKGQKYAKVEFSEDGNPFQIDMYEEGVITRRNNYDDRGFVSSTIVYQNGIPQHQDYLMENGVWKLREYLNDGHVLVNPKYNQYLISTEEGDQIHNFEHNEYASIDYVISEVLRAYIDTTYENDIFCVAMHGKHMGVLKQSILKKKYIASFFSNRCGVSDEGFMPLINNAGYIISDSEEHIDDLRNIVGYEKKIMYMSPFDTRMDFGKSQQIPVQKILVPVDGLNHSKLSMIVSTMGRYMVKNKKAEVHLFSRNPDKYSGEVLLNKCIKIVEQMELDDDIQMLDDLTAEPGAERPKTPSERIFIDNCVDELAVSKCVREQRLVVDFRGNQDLYLQIVAISVGVPQVTKQKSQFVIDGKNGRVLKDDNKLYETLEFYLDGLENWNAAMVHSYELGKQYSTDVLIKKWKEVLSSFD